MAQWQGGELHPIGGFDEEGVEEEEFDIELPIEMMAEIPQVEVVEIIHRDNNVV